MRFCLIMSLSFFLFLFWTQSILGARMSDFEMMEVKLGDDLGVKPGQKEVDDGTLKTVLEGVKKNNPNSIYFYGLFKLYGISLPQDEEVAAEMFRKGADLEHQESMTAYAVMLLNGQGVKEDRSRAMHYFRKAVNKGDMNAHWRAEYYSLKKNWSHITALEKKTGNITHV